MVLKKPASSEVVRCSNNDVVEPPSIKLSDAPKAQEKAAPTGLEKKVVSFDVATREENEVEPPLIKAPFCVPMPNTMCIFLFYVLDSHTYATWYTLTLSLSDPCVMGTSANV